MDGSDVDIETVAEHLLATAVAATPGWVRRSVAGVAAAQGVEVDDATVDNAARRAQEFVERRLGELVRTDIDAQRTTPLSIFRDAVRFGVEVLHGAGATPVHRADTTRWAFPNDPFDITPGNLADIDDELHQAGIVWGAVKAGLHLRRRRDEGMR